MLGSLNRALIPSYATSIASNQWVRRASHRLLALCTSTHPLMTIAPTLFLHLITRYCVSINYLFVTLLTLEEAEVRLLPPLFSPLPVPVPNFISLCLTISYFLSLFLPLSVFSLYLWHIKVLTLEGVPLKS